jgi:hypothetical protein
VTYGTLSNPLESSGGMGICPNSLPFSGDKLIDCQERLFESEIVLERGISLGVNRSYKGQGPLAYPGIGTNKLGLDLASSPEGTRAWLGENIPKLLSDRGCIEYNTGLKWQIGQKPDS